MWKCSNFIGFVRDSNYSFKLPTFQFSHFREWRPLKYPYYDVWCLQFFLSGEPDVTEITKNSLVVGEHFKVQIHHGNQSELKVFLAWNLKQLKCCLIKGKRRWKGLITVDVVQRILVCLFYLRTKLVYCVYAYALAPYSCPNVLIENLKTNEFGKSTPAVFF